MKTTYAPKKNTHVGKPIEDLNGLLKNAAHKDKPANKLPEKQKPASDAKEKEPPKIANGIYEESTGMIKFKCPDCDKDEKAELPKYDKDKKEKDILTCSSCGLELVVDNIQKGKDGKISGVTIKQLVIEGEDWGE